MIGEFYETAARHILCEAYQVPVAQTFFSFINVSLEKVVFVGATTFSILTLSIRLFSITTLNMMGLFATLSISVTQHK